MTKTEIINETAKFYSEDTDRRAITITGCFYYLKSKRERVKKCGVGRCMNTKAIKEFALFSGSIKLLANQVKELDSLFKKKYNKHSLSFWLDIQRFHDDIYYWNETGLTIGGENRLIRLLEKYKDK